jgi:peroxin-1
VIRVEGPELLQKYVGASEKALREIFDRARRRKPTLIILDELDALATKRGSDRSGTTDRLVNQLLTELDGTESRSGVHVLGITSRPDLVDPALLRPGRIGDRLHLNAPNQDERLQILKYLATHLPRRVSEKKLEEMAAESVGLCGAHLRSLLLQVEMDWLHGEQPPIKPSPSKIKSHNEFEEVLIGTQASDLKNSNGNFKYSKKQF